MDPSSKNLSWKRTLCIWNHLWQDGPHVDYLYLFQTRLLLAWLSNTSVSPWKRQWTVDPNVSSHTVTDFFSCCHFLLSTVSFPSKSPQTEAILYKSLLFLLPFSELSSNSTTAFWNWQNQNYEHYPRCGFLWWLNNVLSFVPCSLVLAL